MTERFKNFNAAEDSFLIDQIKALGPWFHQIDLGNGIRTRDIAPKSGSQPLDHPLWRWDEIKDYLPSDMTGLRILDIGCADGYFSFECARRGATVVAIDQAKDRIKRAEWAAKQLRLDAIEFRHSGVAQIDDSFGRFDIVLMLAVLYHLRDPLSCLERVATVCGELFLETIVEPDEDRSFMTLRPPPGESRSPKWIPSKKCVREMLEYAGFVKAKEITKPGRGRPVYIASRV